MEDKKPSWSFKLKEFLFKCNRVWAVMKKPSKEEFKVIAQASALGLLLIGVVGFVIFLLFRLTPLHKAF